MNKETQIKICARCKQKKSINDFDKNKRASDGLTHNCKKCVLLFSQSPNSRARQKRNREKNKEKSKIYLLKRKFNIRIEDYLNLLELQGGVCMLCAKLNTNGKMLAVDHNHKTGKIRGLLCSKCNVGLGQFNDDINVLTRAIQYLSSRDNG